MLRYRPGAEYKPHYDYFDPAQSGTPTILKRGGQRVATMVMYLNTPEAGGAHHLSRGRARGRAGQGQRGVLQLRPAAPLTRTLHGGAPVLAGEKWVATKWMREGRFE